ncbi:hypothetical protein QFC22_001685 [Naganishia vaughanmartiniae]|uniref:Uncharacterized protein n=1 Tax=Naganishia vaughanmartiniae TaxID=1424756 RepID=A0ACC2XFV0_9TREE|nr:hypothetical protein QFC22_001685 [Naganishia vaughanmartiniae]
MPGPQPKMKPGYDTAGRKLPMTSTTGTAATIPGGVAPNRRSVFQSYQGLSRPARIAISGSFFLFALAGYYYEPYVLPLPNQQYDGHRAAAAVASEGREGGVLVDAREGERVPVRLRVVDRSATRGV